MITLALAALPCDRDGYEYGTAAQLAAQLTSPERPITAGMIRKWAWRSRRPGDRLHGKLPNVHTAGERTGNTWYRLIDTALVARETERDDVVR